MGFLVFLQIHFSNLRKKLVYSRFIKQTDDPQPCIKSFFNL